MAGLREMKKARTRVAIAQKGIELFLAHGFDSVSIADIAEAAEVGKITVFNYFPAKEDIFFFLSERTHADLAGAVRARGPNEPILDALGAYVRRAFRDRAEWTGLHEGAERFTRTIRDSPTLNDALRRRWAEGQGELAEALVECDPSVKWTVAAIVAAQITATVHQLVLTNERLTADSGPTRSTVDQAVKNTTTAFAILEDGRAAARITGY